MKPTAIDLFAGAGGLSLGLHEAGFETLMAIDNNEDACNTYRAALPGIRCETADARGFDFRPWKGVDLVAGGPPCQPFSTGGLRYGSADNRDLLPTFVRVVNETDPRAFILENVPGLASTHRDYLAQTLAPLFETYRIFGPVVVNAAAYGAPQSRRRLIVLGTRDKAPELEGGLSPEQWASAGTVIGEKPIGEPNCSIVVYAKAPDLRPDPYHGQLFNGGGRPINLARPAPTILASAGGNKTHWIDLRNMVPAYHAFLLKGGRPRSGALHGARRITVAESALLQTFPAGMRFAGSRSSQYTQVGNAVPPRLGAVLGVAIREAIARASRSRARAA